MVDLGNGGTLIKMTHYGIQSVRYLGPKFGIRCQTIQKNVVH